MHSAVVVGRRGRRAGRTVGLALVLYANAAGAQARGVENAAPPSDTAPVAAKPPAKSATTATLLSVVLPGTGHLYARETRTGVTLLTLFAAGIAIGVAGENATTSPLAVLVGAGPWYYGVIDAHRAVRRYNRRPVQGSSRSSVTPRGGARLVPQIGPVLVPGRGRTPRLGIGVRLMP